MREIRTSELVEDFGLYPRQQVDPGHLRLMCEADEGGCEFPPIVIDKKSKRVIDGFHRKRKQERLHGDDATIQVVEKTYKSEKAMLLDAIRLNANHGRNLSSYDRAHAIILAGNLGISDKLVAGALSIPEDRVGSLRVAKSAQAGGLNVPIKRTIQHMAGRKLTKPQMAAHKKLGGMNQRFYVEQLITLIENNLLDKANDDLMGALRKLRGLLGGM